MRVHSLQAGNAGPPVVLLHGGALDAAGFTWRHTLPALAVDHQVWAPDLPGFGRSDQPDATPSLASSTQVVLGLLDAWGLRQVTLVGLCLGGGVALSVALTAPQRVGRLVLAASYGLGREVVFGRLGYLMVHAPLAQRLTAWSCSGCWPTCPDLLELLSAENHPNGRGSLPVPCHAVGPIRAQELAVPQTWPVSSADGTCLLVFAPPDMCVSNQVVISRISRS